MLALQAPEGGALHVLLAGFPQGVVLAGCLAVVLAVGVCRFLPENGVEGVLQLAGGVTRLSGTFLAARGMIRQQDARVGYFPGVLNETFSSMVTNVQFRLELVEPMLPADSAPCTDPVKVAVHVME